MDTPENPFTVPFTAQQLVLLQKVVDEGTLGHTHEEVCLGIFRAYTQQLFGTDGN
jgi:hypothetical protein